MAVLDQPILRPADLDWADARARAHAAATPLAPVVLPLAEVLDTVLATPVRARGPLPAFDAAAMDGYAVRGVPPWTLVGTVRAGDPVPPPLRPGTAVDITTGAPVPPGAAAVLPWELAERRGGQVTGPPAPFGAHIRRAGEECAASEVVLPAGTVMGAAALGCAAALGHDALHVRPLPTVAALVTGDELLDYGAPGDGRVRDAIGPMLPALVGAAGGRLDARVRVRDELGPMVTGLAASPADLVVVTGASAAGAGDHLRAALEALGAEPVVESVSCRPGHSQCLGRLPDRRLVVGLPGNPLAALAGFLTLVAPAVAGLRGTPLPTLPHAVPGRLRAHREHTRVVPVRIRDGVADELPHSGSAMLRGAALADALAVVPPGEPGTAVGVYALPGAGHR